MKVLLASTLALGALIAAPAVVGRAERIERAHAEAAEREQGADTVRLAAAGAKSADLPVYPTSKNRPEPECGTITS